MAQGKEEKGRKGKWKWKWTDDEYGRIETRVSCVCVFVKERQKRTGSSRVSRFDGYGRSVSATTGTYSTAPRDLSAYHSTVLAGRS